ncbi:TPA: peptidoglycan recognition protein family protein [Clostridium botulinum]|uniref:peptidoglycan recognition protein family protein n=1 Tax=Clostridium botulinum TaxID=1491 RepID=UPI0021BE59D2|nr:N-acetylmuramoyl-L-alanine amidase [Clostridium botulinum]MBY6909501.1 N-acetylmuramoyl-L-alanine amidase [Clostridium botulinum]
MLPITKMPIRYNFSKSAGRTISYIVVHDTGNSGKGAGVDNHFTFFNGADRQSSADFFVDDRKIGQFNPDLKNYYMWHCGDGGGAYGITNRNSIGVEICINSDSNYNQAVNNAVELVQYLMRTFNIPASKVVRHYDASRKNCPASMSGSNWARWYEFKSRLGDSTGTTPSLLLKGSTGSAVTDLQNKLNSLGYNCGVADGIFGTNTYNAVVAFQKDKKLGVDGIVGTQTMNAINSAVANKNKPAPEKPEAGKEGKKVKYLVIYNNYVDKREAERLAEYLQCPTLDGDQIKKYDYSAVEIPIGVGGGNFDPAVKTILKGYDRDDTAIAVLKYIGKLK